MKAPFGEKGVKFGDTIVPVSINTDYELISFKNFVKILRAATPTCRPEGFFDIGGGKGKKMVEKIDRSRENARFSVLMAVIL